jgi:hypothetical protein
VVTVIFLGGIVLGEGQIWRHTPGPYLVGADARSITAEGIAAAEWARVRLGTNHRIATDRTDTLLMGTYGSQQVLTVQNDQLDVSYVFLDSFPDSRVRRILTRGRIGYLVVDERLATNLPRVGSYFDPSEHLANQYTSPIDQSSLDKFDEFPTVSRLFDSGDIVIYNVKGLHVSS